MEAANRTAKTPAVDSTWTGLRPASGGIGAYGAPLALASPALKAGAFFHRASEPFLGDSELRESRTVFRQFPMSRPDERRCPLRPRIECQRQCPLSARSGKSLTSELYQSGSGIDDHLPQLKDVFVAVRRHEQLRINPQTLGVSVNDPFRSEEGQPPEQSRSRYPQMLGEAQRGEWLALALSRKDRRHDHRDLDRLHERQFPVGAVGQTQHAVQQLCDQQSRFASRNYYILVGVHFETRILADFTA